MKPRKKCYIYTWFSTPMQVDGCSLDVHQQKLITGVKQEKPYKLTESEREMLQKRAFPFFKFLVKISQEAAHPVVANR